MKNLKKTMSKIFKVVPALTLVLCSLQPVARSAVYDEMRVLEPPIAYEENDYAVAVNEELNAALENGNGAKNEDSDEPDASSEPTTTMDPDATDEPDASFAPTTEPDATDEPDASEEPSASAAPTDQKHIRRKI